VAANKRTKIQRERDRELIAQWVIEGLSQEKIAEKFGLSRQQIGYDLKIIQDQWRQQTAIDLDEYKGRELAEIALAKKKAWEGWEKSCQEFKAKTLTARADDEKAAQPYSQVIHTESRVGNPRFLAEISRLIERECKLLGLDAPAKIEAEGVIVIDSAPARGVDEDNL
jgi:biotin operon repressor